MLATVSGAVYCRVWITVRFCLDAVPFSSGNIAQERYSKLTIADADEVLDYVI